MQNKLDSFDFEAFSRERSEASIERKEKVIEKKKKNKKLNTIFYAVFGAVCAAIIITCITLIYLEVSPRRNPEKMLKSYINSVIDAKWSKAYDMIDLSNSFFEDKNAFVTYCSEHPEALKLTDAEISDFEIVLDKEENDIYHYSVHYVTADGASDILYITVQKTKDGIGKFDEFMINKFPDCTPRYTVLAPLGAKITIDGKEIEFCETVNKKDYSYGKYIVHYIPSGEHTLIAKADGCKDIALKINVANNNDENSLSLEFELTSEAYDKLCADTDGYINTIFKGIIDDSLTAESLPFSDEFKQTKWDEFFIRLQGEMYKSAEDYKITAFEKASSSLQTKYAESSLGIAEKAVLTVSYKFDYTYNVSFAAEDAADEEKNSSGYINVIYTFDNGEWKIDDIFEQVWF